MTDIYCRVSADGKLTVPAEILELLDVKPDDRIAFSVEDGVARLSKADSKLRRFFMTVPALDPPKSWEEVTALAAEELAQQVVKKNGVPEDGD